MAGKKYLQLGTAGMEEVAATDSSAGAGDATKIVALDASGKIALNMMPSGIGPATKSLVASEAITAPALVNIWNDASVAKIRKADAATNKPANGFILASVASAASAEVYFEGEVTGLSGLVAGKLWLSSTVPGATQTTIPTTAGHIAQSVGWATSATTMDFEAGDPITRA